MNLMIQIYMTVCVVLLIFDIGFLLVKNMRNHRFYPRMTKFEAQVIQEIEARKESGKFSEEFLKSLNKNLAKTKYLIALQSVLEKHPEAREWFKPMIFSCLKDYKKKSDYEQAYYTYVISTLGYENEKVLNAFASEFLTFLDSKSLYTFINTMNAIYEFGETNILIAAIDKIDERAGFYHKKLFADGLIQARVDKKEFGAKLMEKYASYTDYTKACVLDYFRFANIEASEFCMKLVESKTEDDEIRYGAIRYFVKFPNEESKKYFTNILKNGNEAWVEEMLAIQGLSRCTDAEVRSLIKNKITSRNWYVRVNAAEYLQKNGLDKEEILEIVSLDDRYTNETLLYQYQNDKVMSAYIRELIEKKEKGGTK